MTVVLGMEDRAATEVAIGAAVEALAAGAVVGVPTDTVYGLAVDPGQPSAIARLFAVKERPTDVALPVLVASWAQVARVAGDLPAAALALAERWWPGPLTLVIPRHPGFDADLGGGPAAVGTVGIRWPDHAVIRQICELAGPIAVTSANRHGAPPLTTAVGLAAGFPVSGATGGAGPDRDGGAGGSSFPDQEGDAGVALVLNGGTCDGVPSTVADCLGDPPRCLRDGAIPWAVLLGG